MSGDRTGNPSPGFKDTPDPADDPVMDSRTRRAVFRLLGASVVVFGVFVTATAVRRADQVVASGREVLLGGELVDLFSARDLTVSGHAELAGTAAALGDLDVQAGSLRVERDAIRVFAVGGAVHVAETATIVFPEAGALKYGTIRSGATGSSETVLRDPGAVARYAEMTPSLAASSQCFDRAPSTGFVRSMVGGLTLVGDGVSGLQVFTVDDAFVGEIRVSRVPAAASVLVNVVGRHVELAPRGDEWNEIAASTLVNVVDPGRVDVNTGRGVRLNTLVGATDAQVSIMGDRLTGTMLSLGAVDIANTRFEHGPIEAPLLPECAATAPHDSDEVVTGGTMPAEPTDDVVSTTSTTTTTTTTLAAGPQPRGSRAVPGAAFALGGAATESQWWLGVPLTLFGVMLLGLGWIEEHGRLQRERLARRRVAVRVLRRVGLADRS